MKDVAVVDDLVDLYRDSIVALRRIATRRYKLEREDVDDIVQEAWCIFLEQRAGIDAPRAWLSGTIANLCRRAIQQRYRSRRRHAEISADAAVDSFRDAAVVIRQALALLDPRSRALCERLGIERQSYDEVSAALGIPIGSVGPLYMRAKRKLRGALT